VNTSSAIWHKLRKSKKYREEFVAAHVKRAIPHQARALMKAKGMTQEQLAHLAGLSQGVVSRAVDPSNGNLTLNTVIRVAAGFDVAFVGRFVPFSELARWYVDLPNQDQKIPSFEEEDRAIVIRESQGGKPLLELTTESPKEKPTLAPEALSALASRLNELTAPLGKAREGLFQTFESAGGLAGAAKALGSAALSAQQAMASIQKYDFSWPAVSAGAVIQYKIYAQEPAGTGFGKVPLKPQVGESLYVAQNPSTVGAESEMRRSA
jgi:transcriptional regulator with XRE-family HTH domain